jgi:hypothetical protein
MKYLFTAASYFLFIFLISCDSNSDKKEAMVFPANPSTIVNPFPTSNDSSTTGLTVNPEHGKPGHRCELAVGAPLNPGSTNNNIQPNVIPTTIPAEVQKVTPNLNDASATLNPQHGAPGHRCDIAVGAPLNVKPAQ